MQTCKPAMLLKANFVIYVFLGILRNFEAHPKTTESVLANIEVEGIPPISEPCIAVKEFSEATVHVFCSKVVLKNFSFFCGNPRNGAP